MSKKPVAAFIDTNIFLGFYSTSDDNLEELNKLEALIKSKKLILYMTSIQVHEFWRNRDTKLADSLQSIESFRTKLSIPRFLENSSDVKQLRTSLDNAKKLKEKVLAEALSSIENITLDADLLFEKIWKAANLLQHEAETVEKARARRELGNPPGKSSTLGDQISWELLTQLVPKNTDLTIVSKDSDFRSQASKRSANSYLRKQWTARNKGDLFYAESLGEFLKRHFPEVKLAKDVSKAEAIQNLINATSFSAVHTAIETLLPLQVSITSNEAKDLLLALIDNSQINLISEDNDVDIFFTNLLLSYWDSLTDEQYKAVVGYIGDPFPF